MSHVYLQLRRVHSRALVLKKKPPARTLFEVPGQDCAG
eukprot:CAMPEP_0206496786 /NCGR_PEP_ID=MMETSP0324_2-20121206/49690_1 /ASSEMBLY_ACC=CAM_ASM_000836 /TAXON_ID=2866 /ORGANISM="Crypthecodinium cohnii, Strain Seligo" /LENGTH=37 /DNA_ID= /DNA_START= /DNA_END= /DNA_ORIENTATION=